MSPRQLNLRGASCWLDLLLPVLTQEQILMRSAGNYSHSMTFSQTQALRRNIKSFNRIWHFTGYSKVFKLSKMELRGELKLNYATLLKIMVKISHNVNRAQTVFYILHTINYWRFTTQVISHGKRCHVSWCQQNTNDVTRITRQMIRQLNSHDIYRQLF